MDATPHVSLEEWRKMAKSGRLTSQGLKDIREEAASDALEKRTEAYLQAQCEKWLEGQGFRRLTAANAILEGNPRGWFGHMAQPKGNFFCPDLVIQDCRSGTTHWIELKAVNDKGKISYAHGQRQMIDL